ncbi:MAG: hypothetical protein GWO21_15165, partial [Gammaproteobacteria bacterium]|nr:hypothetical protein [Gammaproteobacteria bacterium]
RALMAQAAREDAIDVFTLTTGLTPAGIDIGSPSMSALSAPRPALVVGGDVSSYEAG